MPILGRRSRREDRDDAARPIDQLEIGRKVAQLVERAARQQIIAFEHDEHVELGGWEALRHFLILMKLWRVRPKQLAQRVVDFDPLDTEGRGNRQ